MADVLSQSQIDALLKSMQGGGGDAPQDNTEKEEKAAADGYQANPVSKGRA